MPALQLPMQLEQSPYSTSLNDEWARPKLCPHSWAMTRLPGMPLKAAWEPPATPAHPPEEKLGTVYLGEEGRGVRGTAAGKGEKAM